MVTRADECADRSAFASCDALVRWYTRGRASADVVGRVQKFMHLRCDGFSNLAKSCRYRLNFQRKAASQVSGIVYTSLDHQPQRFLSCKDVSSGFWDSDSARIV